jgi:rubredoxin
VTEPIRSHHIATCHVCGFVLSRKSAGSHTPDYTPGVRVVVNLRHQWVELMCPRCGTRRKFTDIVFSAMTIPELPT